MISGQKYPGIQRHRIWSAPNWSGWLPAGNLDQPGGDFGTKSRSNCGASRTSCFVTVEQKDDFFEMVLKEPLLMLGKGASHEGDHARQTRLVDIETIEESFDVLAKIPSTFRLKTAWPSASIGCSGTLGR
jgi:hypothetical protein